MNIEEYTTTPTADYTPRPNASQEVARAKRARPDSEPSEEAKGVTVPRQWVVFALLGGMLLFVIALSWQLSQPARPLALTPVPTVAATEALVYTNAAPPTKPPAPTSGATVTPATFLHSPARRSRPSAPTDGAWIGRGRNRYA